MSVDMKSIQTMIFFNVMFTFPVRAKHVNNLEENSIIYSNVY